MATQPLGSWTAQAPATAPARLTLVEQAPKFSDLEWSIVAMAERDGLASLREPNRFWSLVAAVFGLKPANRLANDRLEALRRIAVLAWRYRWNVPVSELQAFQDAGYSQAQYEEMQRRIATFRAAHARRTAR